ncbi:hypothetical protein DER45DRAFT_576238, partial [Fusarium avenaceum]
MLNVYWLRCAVYSVMVWWCLSELFIQFIDLYGKLVANPSPCRTLLNAKFKPGQESYGRIDLSSVLSVLEKSTL